MAITFGIWWSGLKGALLVKKGTDYAETLREQTGTNTPCSNPALVYPRRQVETNSRLET
jgi:hypothetical protein